MAEADATAAAPAEEPEEEHPPLTLEEGEDKVKIMALFKKLALADLQEDGKQPTISVEAMKQGGNTALGKGSVNFLKTICQMDFNGDGDVEESEWEMFFAMLKQDNDAKQIDDILNQMEEASGCAPHHPARGHPRTYPALTRQQTPAPARGAHELGRARLWRQGCDRDRHGERGRRTGR